MTSRLTKNLVAAVVAIAVLGHAFVAVPAVAVEPGAAYLRALGVSGQPCLNARADPDDDEIYLGACDLSVSSLSVWYLVTAPQGSPYFRLVNQVTGRCATAIGSEPLAPGGVAGPEYGLRAELCDQGTFMGQNFALPGKYELEFRSMFYERTDPTHACVTGSAGAVLSLGACDGSATTKWGYGQVGHARR